MPVVRFGGTEEEALKSQKQKLEMVEALKTNRAIGDYIVGELNKKVGEVDIVSKLINPAGFHISFSWG